MGESLILSIFFSFKLCYMHLPKTEVWNLSFKVEENISLHLTVWLPSVKIAAKINILVFINNHFLEIIS